MTLTKTVISLALAASLLAGCGTLKKLTGQRDDTVLPGERENILPPEQQVARDERFQKGAARPAPGVGADDLAAEPCNPEDLNCIEQIDQEAGGTGGL